ncbi:MAG: macro domain-containing protein [bacterium]|nr:macro domain-containing protein [bacterium]
MNKVIFEKELNGIKIKVIEGDITEEDVECIVNPANSYLQHGGGVAGAIVRKGGRIIQEESDNYIKTYGPLPVGKAIITSAGSLKAKYVIHTVGPRWGEGDEEKKLRSAIRDVLELASQKGIKSISIPAVSCGIFGYPPELGTGVIIEVMLDFIRNSKTSLTEIHLIGLGREIPELFKQHLEEKE